MCWWTHFPDRFFNRCSYKHYVAINIYCYANLTSTVIRKNDSETTSSEELFQISKTVTSSERYLRSQELSQKLSQSCGFIEILSVIGSLTARFHGSVIGCQIKDEVVDSNTHWIIDLRMHETV